MQKKLNDKCFKQKQIEFRNEDIQEFIEKNKDEKVDIIFLLSVIHQMYPNLEGSEKFLNDLASMARFVSMEVPGDHSKMRLKPKEILEKLEMHFKLARLLYVYDAYSAGYRLVFICYGKE